MAVKAGDRVRFLHSTGGGIVKRTDGRMAYVEEDGFEIPVLCSELVVVIPAGHNGPATGANLMFDQSAYDASRKPEAAPKSKEIANPSAAAQAAPKPTPTVETPYGNKLNILLAFEPRNPKELSKTSFTAVLVNDSNYFLDFLFSIRSEDSKEWKQAYRATAEPNELIDIFTFNHENLQDIENISLQGIAYKPEKSFELKPAVSYRRHLDLKKFYKLHCFTPGKYFDNPVMEIPIMTDDVPESPSKKPDLKKIFDSSSFSPTPKDADKKIKNHKKGNSENPHKLLPPVEVDLHINELLETTAGMSASDILEYQLTEVRKVMKNHSRRIGQKIIFIHGKGDGVLRQAVLKLLRREYPKAELQDASFREYGFGATLVTIH